MRLDAAVFLAAIATSPAAAQLADCPAAKTQTELNDCAGQGYRKADAALNEVYGRLKTKVTDPQAQAALIAAERTWVEYRDRECEFETGGTVGGSIHPMLVAACRREKTVVHTAELNRQLNCQEGDPSCAH